ncbi:DUF2293 domain-containing protein [Aquimarina sp. 2201CG14-23]|uniref:DUF2293 domain-containing protein n=1 Tax=Aquimarina mycalae TaxID=3040073 RepID=UPI002478141F|nr:DUF2293 domain-containing protein [Aquimarina sp. 2201CG14-23]MDH7446477.1 DUF2293 domain-containing protein [Aquimarina sp. 2201CG14-23]
MATISQNIFLTKKEKLSCKTCGRRISLGKSFVAESEDHKGTCFGCSPFVGYVMLPPGDAAMTRRSKKHSTLCGVVLAWNQRRKRYERRGQLVEEEAIEKARLECEKDQAARDLKNKKAAIIRAQKDREYIADFAMAIRERYPNCPPKRELDIAIHSCEKHSGRVGRTADAKQFDPKMIDLAVTAHIRHKETNYDAQFGKGKRKKEIRSDIQSDVSAILRKWQ